MAYELLVAAHVVGAVMLGIAIAAIWLADGKARGTTDLATFMQARGRMTRIEQRMLLPAVFALLVSGVWMVARVWGFWTVAQLPWLAGMVALYVFQAVWANAVGRTHAMRLQRLADEARPTGAITPELHAARHGFVATFGRHVEPLAWLVLMGLGAFRPMSWSAVLAGAAAAGIAAVVAAALAGTSGARYVPASCLSSASVEADGRT